MLEGGRDARRHRERRVIDERETTAAPRRKPGDGLGAAAVTEGTSAAPPLNRASPVAPLASAPRREASAATASTPAPLDTSSAIVAVDDQPVPWTTRRFQPPALPWLTYRRYTTVSHHSACVASQLAGELRLEARPPLGFAAELHGCGDRAAASTASG